MQHLVHLLSLAHGPRGKLLAFFVWVRGIIGKLLDHPARAPVGVPMKALDGGLIWIRPGTSDLANVVAYYRHSLQLPPPEVREGDLRQICELGSNIGASLAALGTVYPHARLLGIEPDGENVALARRNLARFGGRGEVVEAAIWDESTPLRIDRSTGQGEHGYVVTAGEASDDLEGSLEALSIDALLDRHMPGVEIDYIHVSLEGTEERAFAAGGEWPRRVRSLRVELHPYFDYTAARCIGQLEALGYRAWVAPDLPDKWVYAVRADSASSAQTRS